MKVNERVMLEDLAAFIQWSVKHSKREKKGVTYITVGWVLGNVGHDIGGILDGEVDFSPRTRGYKGVLEREEAEESGKDHEGGGR